MTQADTLKHQLFQDFPKLDSPAIDVATGYWTQPWYRFLISLWQRTGSGFANIQNANYVAQSAPNVTSVFNSLTGVMVQGVANSPVDLADGQVTGVLPHQHGGTDTSTAPANGKLLIGNGTVFVQANLTPGSAGVSIVNGPGTITIDLPTVNANVGTFASVTVNGQGIITAATNLSGYGTTAGSVLTVNKVKGATDGSDAAAGDVREEVDATTLIASEVSINAAANVATLTSLPAGDWDVTGELWVDTSTGGATVSGAVSGAITKTSATLPTVPSANTALTRQNATVLAAGTAAVVLRVGPCRISQASAANVYLVGQGTVSAGTLNGYGVIRARRR